MDDECSATAPHQILMAVNNSLIVFEVFVPVPEILGGNLSKREKGGRDHPVSEKGIELG